MSIINQALQKAQREQLRHRQQEMPYRLPTQMARAPHRRWLLALPGLVAAVGVGVTLHTWFLPPTGHVPVRTEPVATSSSPVALELPRSTAPDNCSGSGSHRAFPPGVPCQSTSYGV